MIEDRYRQQMDEVRELHKKNMKALEEKQQLKLSLFNEEKRKLIEEMNKTIELEKEKVGNLQRIDTEQRELTYKKIMQDQKKMYEE